MAKDTDKFLETLEIVEAIIAKMNALGPHKRSALRRWVVEEFKVHHVTAGRYVRLAQERLRTLTGKSAEEHTMRYLAKLDSIIYGEDTPDRNRIAAIDKAALMLGLYRGGIVAPQHGTLFQPLTANNLQEALEQDERTYAAETRPDGESGKVPNNTAPTVVAEVCSESPGNAWTGKGNSTASGSSR